MKRPWLAVLLLLFAAARAAAVGAPASASGSFRSSKLSFQVRGAYAFWGKSASPLAESDERVLRVAVANAAIDAAFFDRFFDRARALDARFVDEESKVVYFEFTSAGKYNGLSFYFGPGDGCGYCYDSEVGGRVRLANGRLQGKLVRKEKSPSFEIDLDVPVPEKEWGTPLPKDGGEIGKVYLAYAAAIEAEEAKKARPFLDEKARARWQKWEQEGKLEGFVSYVRRKEHEELKDPQITGGLVRGDHAVLFLTGKAPYGTVRGEAVLTREGAVWRFSDELLHLE